MGTIILSSILIPTNSQNTIQPTDLEISIHKKINKVREEVDTELPILILHSKLIEIARKHSEDMLQKNYFDHINQENQGPDDRVRAAGIIYSLIAENLYFSSGVASDKLASQAVNGWVKSPGHFRNIQSVTTYTGIGVASSGSTVYITQLFVEAKSAHMKEKGVLFDNEDFNEVKSEKKIDPLLYLTPLIVLIVIIFGKTADKYNKNYYSRKRFR